MPRLRPSSRDLHQGLGKVGLDVLQIFEPTTTRMNSGLTPAATGAVYSAALMTSRSKPFDEASMVSGTRIHSIITADLYSCESPSQRNRTFTTGC